MLKKDSASRPHKVAEVTKLKGSMVPTKELPIETIEKIIKLIQEVNKK